jgi:hypothetical protein
MIPVRTARSNFVYRGPSPDIGDAWVRREPRERAVYLVWQLSDEERRAIAEGGSIELGIYNMEPIPPVSINVTSELPLDAEGAALRDRANVIATTGYFAVGLLPPGCWVVGSDIWEQLQIHHALDNAPGAIPTLWHRPLLSIDEEGAFYYSVSGADQAGS